MQKFYQIVTVINFADIVSVIFKIKNWLKNILFCENSHYMDGVPPKKFKAKKA